MKPDTWALQEKVQESGVHSELAAINMLTLTIVKLSVLSRPWGGLKVAPVRAAASIYNRTQPNIVGDSLTFTPCSSPSLADDICDVSTEPSPSEDPDSATSCNQTQMIRSGGPTNQQKSVQSVLWIAIAMSSTIILLEEQELNTNVKSFEAQHLCSAATCPRSPPSPSLT